MCRVWEVFGTMCVRACLRVYVLADTTFCSHAQVHTLDTGAVPLWTRWSSYILRRHAYFLLVLRRLHWSHYLHCYSYTRNTQRLHTSTVAADQVKFLQDLSVSHCGRNSANNSWSGSWFGSALKSSVLLLVRHLTSKNNYQNSSTTS